jgi:putative lipoprotein
MAYLAAGLLAPGLLAACASQPALSRVSGTVTYRERIAMPPGAVLEVSLEDVSRMDVPATIVGKVTIENPGNVPIAFASPYDPADIDERGSYAVRARILVEGRPRWVSDTANPVLTQGNDESVDILLRAAGNKEDAAAQAGPLGGLPATFRGTVPCASCPGIEMHVDLFPPRATYSRCTAAASRPFPSRS